jgi:hypothetical protein
MAKKDPYGMEKDLKVLKGSSVKHKARLEGQFLGIMPGPELFSERDQPREDEKAIVVRGVKDPVLKIDLNVQDIEEELGPLKEMLHLIGMDPREGDFEVISTLDKVLRALAKAKFKNLAELSFNGKLVYEHPENEWDLRKVLGRLKEMPVEGRLEEAEARVILKEEGDTEVSVKVDKVHTELTHDILIKVDGELDGEMFRRIINYLEDNLEIQELIGA